MRTYDLTDTVVDELRDLTEGRGADSVVDAVGLEAHGNGGAEFLQWAVGLLPDAVARPMLDKAGVDRRRVDVCEFVTFAVRGSSHV